MSEKETWNRKGPILGWNRRLINLFFFSLPFLFLLCSYRFRCTAPARGGFPRNVPLEVVAHRSYRLRRWATLEAMVSRLTITSETYWGGREGIKAGKEGMNCSPQLVNYLGENANLYVCIQKLTVKLSNVLVTSVVLWCMCIVYGHVLCRLSKFFLIVQN